MIPSTFHPATIQLLRLQGRGRRRRMVRRFCEVRRLVLSAIACILAVVWLGNAALTIWLRESGSPETLRALLSLGLVTYAGWHLAKAAFFRPQSPFDWSPTEHELLLAMPLASRDLVVYQLASVTVTTILKATIFTVLLLPDLRSVPLGFVGLLLAMMVLEMLRMAIDIATWGMGPRPYQAYRVAVVAVLVATGFSIGMVVMREGPLGGQLTTDEGLRQRLLDTLVLVSDKVFGYVAASFQPMIDLIVADRITAANVGLATVVLAVVIALGAGVIVLYALTSRRVALREKSSFDAGHADYNSLGRSARESTVSSLGADSPRMHARIPRWGGAGALAWRQMTGARRHWGSLLTAMIAPAVLAAFPVFVVADPNLALLATAGTLAFYTFLLLPTAIRFDFRRDLDHLAVLKGLPITPWAAAIGQISTPVLLATLFQSVVLAFAIAARSLPLYYLALAIVAMIPLNVLVFGLDNVIFLLYPYRVRQEGLEIFLRTMLTFTGKGLLFAGALAAMTWWGFASAALTLSLANGTGITLNTATVFAVGMVVGPACLAALVVNGLARTYRHMNPIEDVPR